MFVKRIKRFRITEEIPADAKFLYVQEREFQEKYGTAIELIFYYEVIEQETKREDNSNEQTA